MKYKFICRIHPAAPFGLPDGDTLVVPSKPGSPVEVLGPWVHARAGIVMGPSSVPVFRPYGERLDVRFPLGPADAHLVDNILTIDVDAPSSDDAIGLGSSLVERFSRLLSVENGLRFYPEALLIEDAAQQAQQPRQIIMAMKVATYDLSALGQSVRLAAKRTSATNETLAKALEYHAHALFLFELTGRQLPVQPFHLKHLVAAAFLFLFKAQSVLVGDPNVDSDYQRRYKALGLDYEFFRDRIERIRRLRNDEDVAHYRLDPTGLQVIEKEFRGAADTVKAVIAAYCDILERDASYGVTTSA